MLGESPAETRGVSEDELSVRSAAVVGDSKVLASLTICLLLTKWAHTPNIYMILRSERCGFWSVRSDRARPQKILKSRSSSLSYWTACIALSNAEQALPIFQLTVS